MKNKTIWIIILVLLLAVAGAAAYIVHDRNANIGENDTVVYDDDVDEPIDSGDEEDIDMDEFDNGISYDEELEGAEITFKDAASQEDFYGTWVADSGHALFLYGDLELTIEEDGNWHGVVVDEEEKGTWTFDGQSMKLTSEFFEADLVFAEDGKLIMQEDRVGDGNKEDILNTVLTKK